MKELPKNYEAKNYEDNLYDAWEKSGFFNPDTCVEKGVTDEKAQPFTIVLPPPNVTGTLHLGHASMLAIQDLMIRYHRMKGDKALWLPGTDHASVATEAKVEKKLINEGMKFPKKELGREKFLQEVEKFAQDSHDTIVNQSKKMGSSLDWSREAYTLDAERSLAVRTVFKKMYDDGLIYRGYRVVNWSVKGQSTCSDDELVYVERQAKVYYFKYSPDFPITIATTRPETKLGDTAIAVNPEDERYQKFIGQTFEVKNFADSGIDLKIKIIANPEVDMTYGTGAVGVTPAHSSVDFDMYVKEKSAGNDIGLIQVIGVDGKLTANAGSYAGLTTLEAREKIVENLKKNDLFIKEEEVLQNVGTSDRFEDVVEALPMTQWFVDVNKKFIQKESKIQGIEAGQEVSLKELMQQVVRSGQIKIIPERFEKTYFHWIDNLRDWCISRQIWFGHRIPVWYKGEEIYVGLEAPEGEGWEQDSDTLDTWFSSGLWTFSTLGWPGEKQDLKTFHPISVMETGYDILFFWVARMILMTTYTLGEIPFETVYLHGLVRDEQGRKMSKSLGNVINPLDTIRDYGADATRLSFVIGNTPGNDLKLSEEKISGFKNFTNKLWNISRFMLLNIAEPKKDTPEPVAKTTADKWFLYEFSNTIKAVTENLENYELSYAGEKLRTFTWDILADWYLEIAKVEGDKTEILNYVLNTVLKMWHPFMPYVTEAIWREVYGGEAMLMVEKWPQVSEGYNEYKQISEEFDAVIRNIIVEIRVRRAEQGIEPSKKIKVLISDGEKSDLIRENQELIKRLWTNVEELNIGEVSVEDTHDGKVMFSILGVDVYLDFSGAVDKDKEIERLSKEKEEKEKYISSLSAKLGNEDFVNNAPIAVVEKERIKLREADEALEKINVRLIELNSKK